MKQIDADPPTDRERTFTQKKNCMQQRKIHTGERACSCTQCANIFNLKANIQKHQRIHKGKRTFSCTKCGKSFPRMGHLVSHQRIHIDERSCTVFDKSVHVKEAFLNHQRNSTREIPLSCAEGKKCFNYNSHLKSHKRIHTGNIPFSCTECEKSFKQKTHLTRHQRIHTGERPFFCLQCKKSFTRKEYLQHHQRIHAERRLKRLAQRQVCCTQCDKSFSLEAGLQRHQAVHTRPYSCTECEKSFSQKAHLLNHERNHTCLRQLEDNNPKREIRYTQSLKRKPAPPAQGESDKEKEDKLEHLERRRCINWNRWKKRHPLWRSIYAEMQAEKNYLNERTEKYILQSPTVSSKSKVLKAATSVFKSPPTVTPPSSPLPKMLVEKCTSAPLPAPECS